MTEAYRYDPAAYRDVFEHHFTYLAGFWRNVHRCAERPALHDPLTGRRWTYAELGRDVSRLAAGLAATGKKMHYQLRDMAVADGEAGLLIRP
jgi:hypothetical protein